MPIWQAALSAIGCLLQQRPQQAANGQFNAKNTAVRAGLRCQRRCQPTRLRQVPAWPSSITRTCFIGAGRL